MDSRKKRIFESVDAQKEELCQISDYIFDHPEGEGQEYMAAQAITDYLVKQGFQVEMGVGGYPTAFRAVYQQGEGGPSIGFLCEYDALKGLGHGCGHHVQGPVSLGAAVALKRSCECESFRLVVYGTPAEETLSAKCGMVKNGCFQDIDVAFMMHAGNKTCTDKKNLAYHSYRVVFHGKSSHAASAPEKGRSAFDALLIAYQGVEFLREHVPEDTKMHYTITELPGPVNIVPDKAVGKFAIRSFSSKNLEEIGERFQDIIKGAALIAGVNYELEQTDDLKNKIPVFRLNDLLMENASLAGAPELAPPREKTGSSDFGNVMYIVPGSCIRIAMVPDEVPMHSQAFVDAGKTEAAHNAIIYGAKSIAGASWDLISQKGLLEEVQKEFLENKKKYQ